MSGNFELKEYNGKGKTDTYSTISAAPTGFEDIAPYTVAVVELDQGARLMAWPGETVSSKELDRVHRRDGSRASVHARGIRIAEPSGSRTTSTVFPCAAGTSSSVSWRG
ncbi:MAG: OB-fold domain-containing protein [Candidatus Rokubacteria bacterium]|nr:OB-fold domain-containing protein [Candidatus Rokubacteria bacterium]